MSFWDFLVWIFWFYILFTCITIFITIFIDIFRDHTLGGLGKTGWIIFLIFLPFLAAFIYLIARGRSMGERNMTKVREQQDALAAAYGAPKASSVDDIAKAKALLDSGALTQAEYDTLKGKALA
jgi:ABC-type multidrug transport system fused ATPase/permease subunit